MTYTELVKTYDKTLTDDECDHILWERTAFPCCDLETLKKQLNEFFDEDGNQINR